MGGVFLAVITLSEIIWIGLWAGLFAFNVHRVLILHRNI